MKVSVIIPTYNGAQKLPNVLQSLLAQTFQSFELIVVVDGSEDNTTDILKEWRPKFSDSVAFYQDRSRGRSNARNSGARLAAAELLFFVDDDMRLEPDCLEHHVHHHEKFPGSLASGAQVYDDKKAVTDFQKYKCMISRNWYKDIEKIYPQPLPEEKLHLTAANFSISKSLFERLGGFDEQVPDMEDFLLAYTAMNQNIPVYYLHEALGWHDDFADIISMQERYAEYKKAARSVAARFPCLQRSYPRYATGPVSLLRRIASRLLSFKFFIRLALDNRLLPEKLRYRLYGAILHAKANLN